MKALPSSLCVLFLAIIWSGHVISFRSPLGRAGVRLRQSKSFAIPPSCEAVGCRGTRVDHEPVNINTTIFCNVELNLSNLEAVGFDMDHTLIQYKESFSVLAFEGTKRKLVEMMGYPEEVLGFQYSADKFRRGLIIDKKLGNVLKTDRHKYVTQAYHGLQELSTTERKAAYRQHVASFTDSSAYMSIDTIDFIVDAVLFTFLVDYKDSHPTAISKPYEEIYADVRQCVDLCHRDGFIKSIVLANPSKYVILDDDMIPMLQQLRASGKKIFLLTNSMWAYSDRVMDYLLHGAGDHADIVWQDLFDLIIVGACKPEFLREEYLSIFKVDPSSGQLHNVEDKESLTLQSLQSCKTFQGGCWTDLHRMLGIHLGDRILYVGDHMYSDILRSKRTLGWRTCLIIPELNDEMAVSRSAASQAQERIVRQHRQRQADLDDKIDKLRLQDPSAREELRLAELEADKVKADVHSSSEKYNRPFNRRWGPLFKAGHQNSRFAKQVVDYACVYTSKASNLGHVSPNRPFRPLHDVMPHDLATAAAEKSNH